MAEDQALGRLMGKFSLQKGIIDHQSPMEGRSMVYIYLDLRSMMQIKRWL
jgi:hypothetical protein